MNKQKNVAIVRDNEGRIIHVCESARDLTHAVVVEHPTGERVTLGKSTSIEGARRIELRLRRDGCLLDSIPTRVVPVQMVGCDAIDVLRDVAQECSNQRNAHNPQNCPKCRERKWAPCDEAMRLRHLSDSARRIWVKNSRKADCQRDAGPAAKSKHPVCGDCGKPRMLHSFGRCWDCHSARRADERMRQDREKVERMLRKVVVTPASEPLSDGSRAWDVFVRDEDHNIVQFAMASEKDAVEFSDALEKLISKHGA